MQMGPLTGDVVLIRLLSSRYTSGGRQICTRYTSDEIDAVAAYCQDLEQCYLVPVELFDGMRGLSLRVAPTQNGQIASINWAEDFLLGGAVAQLGRAPEWHSGGRGFESHQLHSSTQPGEHVARRPRLPRSLRLVHGACGGGRGILRHPPRQAVRPPRSSARSTGRRGRLA